MGWTVYTDEPDVLKDGFQNSLLTHATREGDKLLGVIHTVGNGQTIVYIQDILVFLEYQRKGMGATLMQAEWGRFKTVRQVVLATDNT